MSEAAELATKAPESDATYSNAIPNETTTQGGGGMGVCQQSFPLKG